MDADAREGLLLGCRNDDRRPGLHRPLAVRCAARAVAATAHARSVPNTDERLDIDGALLIRADPRMAACYGGSASEDHFSGKGA